MDHQRSGRERGTDDYGYSYRQGGQGDRDRYGPRGETRYGGYEGGRGAQNPRGTDRPRPDDDDRGFINRAGDEVRSWFGDEEATRRREQDMRYEGDEDYRSTRQSEGQPRAPARFGPQGYGGGGDYASGNRAQSQGRESAQGQGQYGRSTYSSGGDDHGYSNWRQRQIEQLDKDYDEYRREHQSQFDTQFGSWREKRTSQRGALGKVQEHMDVVGSDGQHIGTVDKVKGDRIILTKNDAEAGGRHHSIPCSWIETVDDKVTVNKTHDEAQKQWKDEERNSAMFGQGGDEQTPMTGSYSRSSSGNY